LRDVDQGDCRTAGSYFQFSEGNEYRACLEVMNEIPLSEGKTNLSTVNVTRQVDEFRGETDFDPAVAIRGGEPDSKEIDCHQGREKDMEQSVSRSEFEMMNDSTIEVEDDFETDAEVKARENYGLSAG
jgi:hypothetical protein